ncbi:probable inorganic polyphosphate/ATP-NAD kinase [Butyrivibrio sp. CAG:318]|nr:probable inorganic polyphosphate/ATP-NAD kinase [Butyrivibrio sp. CAG:318]
MNKFYVIANSQKDMDFAMADKISEYIIAKGGTCVCQKRDIGKEGIKYNSADASLIPDGTECVIVLGGDGTLIQAARDLSSINVPVFGINIGTLGYLTEIDMEQAFPAIDRIMADEYNIDTRMILRGRVYRGDDKLYSDIALNDIVINRMGSLKIINFDIFVNGEYLITYPADGLIVSTPTGSTAYNLSAGGPIVRPQTDCIVMTPVCPHVLNKSSVIFGGEDVLEVRMTQSRSGVEERVVTFDGTDYINLISGDRIVISRSDTRASLIRIGKHNFLQILRNKLS